MLLPFPIGLPLYVAVRCVVNAVIALEGAISPFGPIAWLKLRATRFAISWRNQCNRIQQVPFPFKGNGCIAVNRIPECNDIRNIRKPNNLYNIGMVMLANSRSLYPDALAPILKSFYEFGCAGYANRRESAARNLFDVNTSVSIENPSYERPLQRSAHLRECGDRRFGLDNPMSRQLGAHSCRAHTDSNEAAAEVVNSRCDLSFRFYGSNEFLNMRGIFGRKAKHDGAPCIASVGHEKAKPVRLLVGIDAAEEHLINSNGAWPSHAVII